MIVRSSTRHQALTPGAISWSRERVVRGKKDRFPNDNSIAAISGPDDEERIDRNLRDQRQREWAARNWHSLAKQFAFRLGHARDRPIALDGNNLAATKCAQEIERKERAFRVVVDLDRAFADLFHGRGQMPRGLHIFLRRAHHPQFTMEFLREHRRAEIVVSHVGGEHDRSLGGSELIQEIGAFDLEAELDFVLLVVRRFGDRPRKIEDRLKGAEVDERAAALSGR